MYLRTITLFKYCLKGHLLGYKLTNEITLLKSHVLKKVFLILFLLNNYLNEIYLKYIKIAVNQ